MPRIIHKTHLTNTYGTPKKEYNIFIEVNDSKNTYKKYATYGRIGASLAIVKKGSFKDEATAYRVFNDLKDTKTRNIENLLNHYIQFRLHEVGLTEKLKKH